ncbi:MAG: metallophosphoesterase [Candidatus Bathyarchaeia archaeon]|nr:metallophosphoesterase [Candidatus Bathyarchaeota archaeon]
MDSVYRIVHISDTHITKYGQFLEEKFDEAVKKIGGLEPPPDMVVHTGDLTDNGVLADYEFAVEKLKMIRFKVIVAAGNHDERNYGQSLFREMISPLEYEVDEGKYRFFVVNSPQPDRDEGRLGRRRQSYLEERFRKLPADSFKILVFHHHLVPVPYSGRETNVLEDAGDILEMVLRFDVNLILMGHRHVRRVLRIEDTMLVNAGTLSSTRTRGRFGHSFNIIEIDSYGRVEVNEFNLG